MKLYIYKIFDLNTSAYFSDVYFNIEDASRAVYSAIKQNPNVELHKLFLTHIVDLTLDEDEDTTEQDNTYTGVYALASTLAALNLEEEITLSMQKLKKLYPHIF